MLKFPLRLLLAVTVLAGALFAQRYQGRDHTIFHAPVPPAKHAAVPAATATVAHPGDATRHHDANFTAPPTPHAATTVQATEPLHHPK